MLRVVAAFAAAVLLAGCATATMKSYVGRTVPEIAVRYGPPTNAFDMGDGRRAFQWAIGMSYTAPTVAHTNVYAPPGGAFATATTTVTGGQTYSSQCLYTVYARWNEGRNTWVVESFEKPSWLCE